jgi:thiol-disulfide isomerase/thioredoxin
MMRLLLLLAALALGGAARAATQPFEPTSYDAILRAHEGRPFVLALWSIDCPPCHAELAMLGELRRTGVPLDLVLVSTDGMAAREAIERTLAVNGLGDAESWAFGSAAPERLRFTVDRRWRGELPFSYLFDGKSRRTAHVGRLERAQLEAWLLSTGASTLDPVALSPTLDQSKK